MKKIHFLPDVNNSNGRGKRFYLLLFFIISDFSSLSSGLHNAYHRSSKMKDHTNHLNRIFEGKLFGNVKHNNFSLVMSLMGLLDRLSPIAFKITFVFILAMKHY